jgi:hypothetical protein
MAQQTAMERLKEKLKTYLSWSSFLDEEFEQAKAMEKEQIEQAFSIGEMNNDSHHYTGRKIHKDQTDYFKKTYAK